VALAGTALYVVNLYVGFIQPVAAVPIMVVFALLMVTSSFRMVPMQALATRVPEPRERARYMSAQSAVQHIACSVGSMLGAAMLVTAPDGQLIGMPAVATFAAVVAMLVPGFVWLVDQRVRASVVVAPVAPQHSS
jgi:predicted MFS family arabinose efflux permease